MCGLTGLFHITDSAPIDADLLGKMTDVITHRGPDDDGTYLSEAGHVGLGSRRLSIIDLSPAGHMPMHNADGSIWIAYNGESYNFAPLREDLIRKGHTFKSTGDTEVVLHLYEEYGPDCVKLLRGMYAFAIWDTRKQRLMLARDRIGIKPLYYTQTAGKLIFGSEIKSILQHPQVERRVDETAFYHFMTFLTSPAPNTLFAGIKKLPPAHYALIGLDGALNLQKYWDPFDDAQDLTKVNDADAAQLIQDKLRESIKLRMVSDVPFGVLLSGGIDSSTNVALMAEQMDRPVQTYTIGYEGQSGAAHNEFMYARQVAQQFGADHHELQLAEQDLLDFLPKLIYHQDEPIADPVCVPVYFVSKLAKDSGTTVVQVGEGADELYSGYSHWIADQRLMQNAVFKGFGMLPKPLRKLAYGASQSMLSEVRAEYVRRTAHGEELFWGGAIAFGERIKRRLLSPSLLNRVGAISSHEIVAGYRAAYNENATIKDDLSWMTYVDLNLRLPELLLMRVDKMAMATSIEPRVPFLDHEFVSLALSFSQRQKIGTDFQPKKLLKQAVRGVIPDEIIDRKKQGFSVPVKAWLNDTLGNYTREKLQAFCARTDYFNWPEVERLLNANDELVWYLLNFVLWHELWIEEI